MSGGVEVVRAVRACAVVAALVAAVPLADLALGAVSGAKDAAVAGEGGLDLASLADVAEPASFLDGLEEALSGEGAEVPGPFLEEVGFLEGARDVRADSGAGVVGYLVDGDAAQVAAKLRAAMQERGWVGVDLGSIEGATYVKEGGSCTWALATCTQVGDATSVVVRGRFE